MRKFTLIEAVVSLVILSLALAGMLRLLTHSQSRINAAEEKWREMHMLTQGAEYFLLTGSENDLNVPDEVFPYEDHRIDGSVSDAEGLPEELVDQDNQLPLKKWEIRLLRTSDNSERMKVIIDRFDYQSMESENAAE